MDQCPVPAFLTNKCGGFPVCSCVSAGRSSRASTGRDFLCFIYNCCFSQLAGHLEHSLLYLESNFCPCWGKLPKLPLPLRHGDCALSVPFFSWHQKLLLGTYLAYL